MRNSGLLILEIVWIIIGIASVAAGINYAISPGGMKTIIFFLMALIAFLFAYVRHTQRKKQK
ncbi:MAG: hypothetical protein ABR974_08235 [Bacteroidales bacterium]|jgi:uncharacterized membrane protein YbaN (DUF454 family)